MKKKPILILGKGPSAIKISPNDRLDVAAVTNTLTLCPDPTYSVWNDIEPMCFLSDEDFKQVTNIICSSYLHSQYNLEPDRVIHVHWEKLGELFPGRFDHVDFLLYELHPGDNSKPEEQRRTGKSNSGVPSFGFWPYSVGVTATAYLSMFLGYQEFIVSGFDPEGGYHPSFEGLIPKVEFTKENNTYKQHIVDPLTYMGNKGKSLFKGQASAPQPPQVYPQNYNAMKKVAMDNGCIFRHINELSLEEKKHLKII